MVTVMLLLPPESPDGGRTGLSPCRHRCLARPATLSPAFPSLTRLENRDKLIAYVTPAQLHLGKLEQQVKFGSAEQQAQ